MKSLLDYARPAMYLSLAGWVLSLFMLSRVPEPQAIRPALFNSPVQTPTSAQPFHFYFKNQDVEVIPKAEYEISGLIVSHNDPAKWYRFDITHDDLSLNTRDLCLIWGQNVQHDYTRVNFHNDDYMCIWRYGNDIAFFNDEEVSNNHLITANEDIRRRINRLHVGDQVTIKGKLVSYRENRWSTNRMHDSSMRRDDTGPGACEIILVEKLDVLYSHNQFWAWVRFLFFWAFVIIITVRTTLFLAPHSERYKREKAARKKRISRRWSNED